MSIKRILLGGLAGAAIGSLIQVSAIDCPQIPLLRQTCTTWKAPGALTSGATAGFLWGAATVLGASWLLGDRRSRSGYHGDEFDWRLLTWGCVGVLVLCTAYPATTAATSAATEKAIAAVHGATSQAKSFSPILTQEAQRLERDRGIPAALTIAIANHETDRGKKVIGKANFYGLKCSRGPCIAVKTTEHYGGKRLKQKLLFESCENPRVCTEILGNTLINELQRNGGHLSLLKSNPEKALDIIGQSYATDGRWSKGVKRYLAPSKTTR